MSEFQINLILIWEVPDHNFTLNKLVQGVKSDLPGISFEIMKALANKIAVKSRRDLMKKISSPSAVQNPKENAQCFHSHLAIPDLVRLKNIRFSDP